MDNYNEKFKNNHQSLSDLVSWLKTWDRYTQSTKRTTQESDQRSSKRRINRDDGSTNETS